MGGGSYSFENRTERSVSEGYHTKSIREIFESNLNSHMNPYSVELRESRDSEEHPESLAIVIGLDVTGSMGSVPHYLVKNGLPNLMKKIIDAGIVHPQVLFTGLGDHTCDKAPFQVGQFESSDELLDHWLTKLYLEGGGGGNNGESYMLPWYFAGYRTAIDCFEKRGQKGFLFTIGDEPVLKEVPAAVLKKIFGSGQYEDFTSSSLFEKASEMYNVFHINIKSTRSGVRESVYNGWKQLIQDNLLVAESREDVSGLIADAIVKGVGTKKTVEKEAEKEEILL